MAEIEFRFQEYIDDVLEDRIVVCHWVRQAVRRHVGDLKDGHTRGLYFDAKAAKAAIAFFMFLKQFSIEHRRNCWIPAFLHALCFTYYAFCSIRQ